MDIFPVLLAVSVTALVVGGIAVGVVWGVSLAATRVIEAAGKTAADTVTISLKAVTGGLEASELIEDGVVKEDETVPFFPPHEMDDLMIPGSTDEATMREAGWQGPQATQPRQPPA